MKIINQTKNTILAQEAVVANTVFKRIKGLLAKKDFQQGEALILNPCNSIHTLFMRFPIDVIFLDRQNKVVKVIPGLNPWRFSGVCFSARLCVELPVGTTHSNPTSPGDTLSFIS